MTTTEIIDGLRTAAVQRPELAELLTEAAATIDALRPAHHRLPMPNAPPLMDETVDEDYCDSPESFDYEDED